MLELRKLAAVALQEKGEYAPGIPSDRSIKTIPTIKGPQTWQLAEQKHEALRAGTHMDLRLVDPHGHAHSWAVPKGALPSPGQRVLAIQQPTHTAAYSARRGVFSIPEGYGKGRVTGSGLRPVEVVRSSPNLVQFTTHEEPKKGKQRYNLFRTSKGWLLQNNTLSQKESPTLGKDTVTHVETKLGDKLREELSRNPEAYIGQAVKVHEEKEKTAEPPPPKGVSLKVWDKLLSGKIKKAGKLDPAPKAGLTETVIKGLPSLLTYKYITGPYLHEGIERHRRMMQAVREGWPAGMAAE